MKRLYFLLLTIVAAATVQAQGTYSWIGANNADFQVSTNWSPSRTVLNAGDILQFNAGNTRTITNFPTSQTIAGFRVTNNTSIRLQAPSGIQTMTVNNGAGVDFQVESGSTFIQDISMNVINLGANTTASIDGTYTLDGDAANQVEFNNATSSVITLTGLMDNNGGVVGSAAAASFVATATAEYAHRFNGGDVPVGTWNAASTLRIAGVTTTFPGSMAGQSFGNMIIANATNSTSGISASFAVQNLTVQSTGTGAVYLTGGTTDRTLTVNGNYSQTSGGFGLTAASGDGIMNVTGTFSISGGTFTGKNGSGLARLTTTGLYSQSGGTVDLWASSATNSATINANGGFSMTGGSFDMSGTNGSAGQLNVVGNYTHSAGTITESATGSGNIAFAGTATQTFTGGGTVNNNINFTVNNNAKLQMATNATVVTGNGFTVSAGGTLGIMNAVGITAAGTNTGNIQTTNRTFNAGGNYIYNGTAAQTTLGTAFPNNLTGSLTIDNANGVALTTGRTFNSGGDLFLTNGAFAAGNNLTMSTGSSITRNAGSMTGTLQGTGVYSVTYLGASKSSTSELTGSVGAMTMTMTVGEIMTLSQPKTMTGVLTLTSGIITTTATNLLSLTSAASTTGASNNSFVNGPLAKATASTATFTFPVGTLAGGLRTIAITPASNSATTFTGTFFDASPKTAFTGATLGTGLQQISNCEYWTLDRSTGGTPANGTVTLSWNASTCGGSPFVTQPTSLKVARYNGAGQWVDAGYSTSNSVAPYTTGTVTSGSVTAFSPFTIGTTSASQNPLPVMFADVRAYAKNDGVQIEWSNLTERELINYTVERSTDGSNFTTINTQLPKYNNNDKASYTHFDASPVGGANYYRIRVSEQSGKLIYSKVLRVDMGNTKKAFGIYPNPVTGRQFTVSMSGMAQGQYTLKVINAAGQPVYEAKIINQSSSTTQTLELPASVKPGVYTTVLSNADYRESKLFIVQ